MNATKTADQVATGVSKALDDKLVFVLLAIRYKKIVKL